VWVLLPPVVYTGSYNRKSLHNKLEIVKDCQDVNPQWQQIKDSVLNTAIEVIQNEHKKPQNEWWDGEVYLREAPQRLYCKTLSRWQ
jgi:hypothetical protein